MRRSARAAVAAAAAVLLTTMSGGVAARATPAPQRDGDAGVDAVIARYQETDPRADGRAGHPRPRARGGRRRPGGVAAGVRVHGTRRRYAGHRRHDLQRPVDDEDVHRHRRDAGRPGRTPRPRRADHDVPARLHGPQRLRAAPRAADHPAHAARLYGGLHPRGAAGQQLRARARRLRRARAEHLEDVAALPRRHRLRLLQPGVRRRRRHPRAGLREALPGAHA